jgi:uncharacterized repeat protein (TIGR03806 family)
MHRARTALALLLVLGCGAESAPDAAVVADAEVTATRPNLSGPLPYDTLSTYGFFAGPMVEQRPAPGVVPYEVNAPLWSDGMEKARFILLPEGTRAVPNAEGEWDLPVGTVLIKTFADGARVLETRLLIKDEAGFEPHVYLWDEDQREARRIIAGKRLIVGDGQTYLVPNRNQCGQCHERDDVSVSLGVVTRQMDRGDQLDRLLEAGVLARRPEGAEQVPTLVDPYGDGDLERRARSWLDANCAHCHRPGGGGGPSGLVLLADETNPTHYGVCKGPVAAGGGTGDRLVDLWPGHPERSIIVHRLESSDPEEKMPELPNLVPDPRGVALVKAWIAAMAPVECVTE